MPDQKEPSAGARAGLMFAIAALCFIGGFVVIDEEQDARYAEGEVVSKRCSVSERNHDGDRFTTCEVRIVYQIDGQQEAERANLELIKTYVRRKEPFAGEPGPAEGETLRIDVTGDAHEVVSPTRFEAGRFVFWGGALICAAVGISQLRDGRKRRAR